MRYLTAGESHGRAVTTIIEGLPAGLALTAARFDSELSRRKLGFGRGGRMSIEADKAEILSGLRYGRTLGSPLAVMVENLDHRNWTGVMASEDTAKRAEAVTVPRPGHADLAGGMKYGTHDVRDILERASARETVGRVCAGTAARVLLESVGIEILSHVTGIGALDIQPEIAPAPGESSRIDSSPVRCIESGAEKGMVALIEKAMEDGDSLGGRFEVLAFGVPPGLGSHVHWDRRADGLLAQAVMSIPAIKSVEIGQGDESSRQRGTLVQDPIEYEDGGFTRPSNRAGGIEGGITNGQTVVLKACMKPIPTTRIGTPSVDFVTKKGAFPASERADSCAVPAAAVVAESAVAWILANLLMEKLGGDTLPELEFRYRDYLAYLEAF